MSSVFGSVTTNAAECTIKATGSSASETTSTYSVNGDIVEVKLDKGVVFRIFGHRVSDPGAISTAYVFSSNLCYDLAGKMCSVLPVMDEANITNTFLRHYYCGNGE
jgi:hypothetical protein